MSLAETEEVLTGLEPLATASASPEDTAKAKASSSAVSSKPTSPIVKPKKKVTKKASTATGEDLVHATEMELVNEASMEDGSDKDDNSNDELEMAVQIPEEDMRWLARSAIVLLHTTDGKEELVSLINKLDPMVLVRDFSNIMILLTVEEDQSLNDCILLF
ncbi:hypothetical protein COLO4_24133 [Corchorus olitorius]|uniref:Uncharacterized protein n=1 Tax=Corchorus olitorius TaxID=93759 RepID=A0A1R3ICT3_9ROSI|nr:hypothetical protein COLO4_24133 [Corchorus olitorius]